MGREEREARRRIIRDAVYLKKSVLPGPGSSLRIKSLGRNMGGFGQPPIKEISFVRNRTRLTVKSFEELKGELANGSRASNLRSTRCGNV